MTTGRHPSDAERERVAGEVLEPYLLALSEGDVDGVATAFVEDCVWFAPEETLRGRTAVAERHRRLMEGGLEPRRVRQHGPHALVEWVAPHGSGAIVLEVRRGGLVFGAEAGPRPYGETASS
jgi:ketosteroid isomerase-like protein